MTTICRATDHHNTMAAIHPKPKASIEKKVKHAHAEKLRKKLERQIEDIIKLIIFWRDGQQCVMSKADGARCGNGLMWNHYIRQKQSNWMRLDLGNVFCGCGNHNMLDFRGDKTLTLWFFRTFGLEVSEAMNYEKTIHIGRKRTIYELEEMLVGLDQLYQNRFTADLDLRSLIYAGFYGNIIKKVWSENEQPTK